MTPPGDRRRGIARRVLDPVGTCGLQRGSERQPRSAPPHRPRGSVAGGGAICVFVVTAKAKVAVLLAGTPRWRLVRRDTIQLGPKIMTPKEVRSRRLALGMSVEQLAREFGMSAEDVRAMESGERTLVSVRFVERVLARLERKESQSPQG
jgi:hypothetical protein